jgi:hypothetical protein
MVLNAQECGTAMMIMDDDDDVCVCMCAFFFLRMGWSGVSCFPPKLSNHAFLV